MSSPYHSRPAELRLETVGTDRIVVAAAGDLTSESFDYVASRLARLVAGAPARVQIDCSRVTSMVPVIADLFAKAAAMLASGGGALELTGVTARLGLTDRLDLAGCLSVSNVDGPSSVVVGIIGALPARTRRNHPDRSSRVESTGRVAS